MRKIPFNLKKRTIYFAISNLKEIGKQQNPWTKSNKGEISLKFREMT